MGSRFVFLMLQVLGRQVLQDWKSCSKSQAPFIFLLHYAQPASFIPMGPMATHSLFWPGESRGQGSLASYSPQRHKELNLTAVTQNTQQATDMRIDFHKTALTSDTSPKSHGHRLTTILSHMAANCETVTTPHLIQAQEFTRMNQNSQNSGIDRFYT